MSISKIILLTGDAEAPILADILQRHNSALAVTPVTSTAALHAAFADLTPETRLLSFCSPVIVPAALLAGLTSPAYNFHPGPPERPGRYPAVFALYDRAEHFGVTIHEMAAKVDSGAIVSAGWFEIPADATLPALEELTLRHLLRAFQQLAPYLATIARPLPRLMHRWSGRKTTKAQCDALCQLTPGLDQTEVARRARACGVFLKHEPV